MKKLIWSQSQACRFFSQSRSRARDIPHSVAPKPNVKHISHNPELWSNNCKERNYREQSEHPFKIVQLYDQWRGSQANVRGLRKKSNAINSQLSPRTSTKRAELPEQHALIQSREGLIQEARKLKDDISITEAQEALLATQINDLAVQLPNLTSPETPRGEPRVLGYINERAKLSTDIKQQELELTRDHVQIGAELDLLDFSGAATTSGWGWYFLENEGPALERALVAYALSIGRKHGFAEVSPPSMVYSHIGTACGFRPRDQNGEQQIYRIQSEDKDQGQTKPNLSLAGTAEIPFAGKKANTILNHSDLPIKIIGSSRCFRAEAGARGTATRGLYRVHEFTKVEMFAWTSPHPAQELSIFATMLQVQTEILTSLGLYCRILEMPSADLGASAYRKQDIEVFFPSRRGRNEGWGEVTSTSICTDYQTRRLNTRMKNPVRGEKKTGYPSTVNGTAMAVPRVSAAVLEYWCEREGGEVVVRVPEVLWPWMDGVRVIRKKKKSRGKSEK